MWRTYKCSHSRRRGIARRGSWTSRGLQRAGRASLMPHRVNNHPLTSIAVQRSKLSWTTTARPCNRISIKWIKSTRIKTAEKTSRRGKATTIQRDQVQSASISNNSWTSKATKSLAHPSSPPTTRSKRRKWNWTVRKYRMRTNSRRATTMTMATTPALFSQGARLAIRTRVKGTKTASIKTIWWTGASKRSFADLK